MTKRGRTKIPADAVWVRNDATGEHQCTHKTARGKIVGTPKLTKSQRWQKFTWEKVCADCGVVIKKKEDKHK